MAIANGLALPNPLSNGTPNDAVALMADLNYLLSAANRALLDAGGGAGVNAQSTQIHNLANGTAPNDAVNLSQLGAYALLAGAAFTGSVSVATTLGVSGATTLAALVAASLNVVSNATIGGTLLVGGVATTNDRLTVTSPTLGNFGLIINGSSTAGAGTVGLLQLIDSSNSNGANLKLMGDGATAPAKFLKVSQGVFYVVNSAYTANLLSLTDAGNLTLLGAITATAPVPTAANSVGYAGIPSVAKTANYTLALSDVGGAVNMNATGLTLTIPANASVAIPVDSVILVTNLFAGNLTIAITSDTLTMSGTTNTGSRTLGQNGEARLRKISATQWLISGTALS